MSDFKCRLSSAKSFVPILMIGLHHRGNVEIGRQQVMYGVGIKDGDLRQYVGESTLFWDKSNAEMLAYELFDAD